MKSDLEAAEVRSGRSAEFFGTAMNIYAARLFRRGDSIEFRGGRLYFLPGLGDGYYSSV